MIRYDSYDLSWSMHCDFTCWKLWHLWWLIEWYQWKKSLWPYKPMPNWLLIRLWSVVPVWLAIWRSPLVHRNGLEMVELARCSPSTASKVSNVVVFSCIACSSSWDQLGKPCHVSLGVEVTPKRKVKNIEKRWNQKGPEFTMSVKCTSLQNAFHVQACKKV